MKHLFLMAAATLVATSANAAEMKWSGSAGWRYDQASFDNGLGDGSGSIKDKAHGVRANLGVTGGWENVEWGTGIRTGSANANDDHILLNHNVDPKAGIEQAWFRYVRDFGMLDLSVTAGRQKNVFAYDTVGQTLFDNDVRFDGLGWQLKFGMFGLNIGQYVMGSDHRNSNFSFGTGGGISVPNNGLNSSTGSISLNSDNVNGNRLAYVFGFQPHMNWKFTDEIEAMIAVGYYIWNDESEYNQVDGLGGAYLTYTNANAFRLQDARQWQVTASVSLPYNLYFNGEWVMNKKQNYDSNSLSAANLGSTTSADRTAWSAGLTYGAIKKAHDFSVGYAYSQKGLASVMDAYSYENFLANNKGHTVEVNYAVADNFMIGWKGLFLKEMKAVDPTTGGAYADNRSNKTNYWEITSGVMF